MKRLFFSCILIYYCFVLFAQTDPFYINYTAKDGLPTDNIYSVFYNKGIIWFTTGLGVVKYNGKDFQTYNTSDGLSSNEVIKMHKDSKGRIWLLTLNGKPSLLINNTFYSYKNSKLLQQINGTGYILDFTEDDNQSISLSYRNGEVFEIDKDNIVRHWNSNLQSAWGIWNEDQQYFVISEGLIYEYPQKIYHKISDIKVPIRTFKHNKQIYVTGKNSIYIADKYNLKLLYTLQEDVEITYLYFEDDIIWICTKKGLYKLKQGTIQQHYFKEDIISGIVKDIENNYWITTLNRGVLFIPAMDVINHLKDIKITCLSVIDNKLWIGSYNNEYYTLYNNLINTYQLDNANKRKDRICAFRKINDAIFVVGKTGLQIIGKNKHSFIEVSGNDILALNNNFYYATTSLSKFPLNQLNKTFPYKIINNIILNRKTNVLCADNKQQIWIGTNNGLYYKQANDSIIFLGKNSEALSDLITTLYYDSTTQTLLVGTESNGILLIKNNKIILNINESNNLNSNSIYCITQLDRLTYLVGTINGLNKISINTNLSLRSVESYNSNFGLQNQSIRAIEVFNNKIYLGTNDGLISFPIVLLQKNYTKPICIINNILNNGKPIKNNTLKYNNNNIYIEYSGISYKDHGNVVYYYKFKEDKNNWTSTNSNTINFKKLPFGNYTFQIYCVNSQDIKSNIQSVSFKILPAFWQTIWFKIITISLILLIIFWMFKIRIKQINEKNKIEKEKIQAEKQIIELEQKALRMQMNPHFIFNALNTIKGYYAEGNATKANDFIAKFSKLLRKLLEQENQYSSLQDEIEMLQLYLYLTKIRYQNKFDFNITIDKNLNSNEIAFPFLLIQPIVENAILHGLAPKTEKGNLTIQFIKQNNHLLCTIQDDGIGRANAASRQQNKQSTSKAIDIVKERLQLFDSSSTFIITDLMEKNIATGTKVDIIIPIKKLNYENNYN